MDPFQIIKHDHQAVYRLFRRMERALTDDDEREQGAVLRDVVRELSVHAAIEEQFLYPTLRSATSEDALYAVEEHHAVKVILAELEAGRPGDERFAAKARLLMTSVREHIEREERDLLPVLERALPADERRELGAALESARLLSPTRPHPSAPDTPPGNLLAGPVVAVFDRLRDALRDGAIAIGRFTRSALETAVIMMRRVSTQAERRGREVVDDLAGRTRVAAEEVREAGRRTVEEAAGHGAEAARQLREPARRPQRTRRGARRRARALG